MIDFRYHVVSLVALFLALAGGIALGAGPLQDPVRSELATSSSGDDATAAELAQVKRLSDFQADYGHQTAGLVLGDRLTGRSVSVLVLPGADPDVVRELTRDVVLAGGRVVSTVSISADLVDPAKRQLADSLVQGVLDGVEGAGVAADATGYQLVGATLGRAFLTGSAGRVVPDDSSASIQAAFEEAGFLAVDGAVERRAQLALVVAGAPSTDAPDGQDAVVADLVAGMDRTDLGTVVAGTTGSASGAGAVAAVRRYGVDSGVSTADAAETSTGQLVGVLALVEQAAGGAGHYGPDAPDGAVPAAGR